MPLRRDSSSCLSCRNYGFRCQPQDLDERECTDTYVPQLSRPNHIESLQDQRHEQSPTYLDRSGDFSRTAISESDSEPSPTLKPQSISLRSHTPVNHPLVSRSDLEQCRQALRRTFQDCDKAEFRLVSCLISCMLSSARWLSRPELLAATILFDPERVSKISLGTYQWPQEEYWLRKCNPIIAETFEGNVIFRSRAIKVFLRSFSIPGIDSSHRTLALICRNQIELDRRFARDVTSQKNRPDIFRAVQMFASYSAEFGNHHLRAASLTSMISIADDPSLSTAKDGGSGASDDLDMISKSTKHLSLSEDTDDWVLVAPTRTS